jgi:hypothetical protein
MNNRLLVSLVALIAVLAASTAHAGPPLAIGGTNQFTRPAGPYGSKARSLALPADAPVARDVVTIPRWQSVFQYGGQTWGSLMVGTDPAAGSATTTIPVTIVPLQIRFARDDQVQAMAGMAAELTGSALFQPTPFITGTTQYLDAFRRADFWAQVSTISPDYHVLLGAPTITDTQTLTVPAAKGLTYVFAPANRRYGIADGPWFYEQLKQMVASLRIDPRSLVVFLGYNVDFTWQGTPDSCFTTGCSSFAGVHGSFIQAGPEQSQSPQPPQSANSFIYASFEDFGDLVPAVFNTHFLTVSHELLEWLNDPVGINVYPNAPFTLTLAASLVPTWTSPYFTRGCSHAYEVSDPLESGAPVLGIPNNGRIDLLEGAVFQSWFARQSPSNAVLGLYDTVGAFAGPSTPCP